MSSLTNSLGKATTVSLSPSAASAATFSSTGVDVTAYEGEALVVLDSSAGGSGATMDTVIEESSDNSSWAALAQGNASAFTQVTNAAASHQVKRIDLDKCKQYLRVTSTIAGTASFKNAVVLVANKKYAS